MPFDSEITTKSHDQIVLEKARELIKRGWCQNQREDSRGHMCIVGAIESAMGGFVPNVYEYVDQHFAHLFGIPGESVDAWNDTAGRKQAEVVSLFDAAIARLSSDV